MIYCLEDDESGRELIIYALRSQGFEAVGFGTAKEFWSALKKSIPELIILDIMLPDESGIQVLKKLRSNVFTQDIPILMETAKGTEYDKVLGFDLGADDYLAKPFGMMEFISRVKALLRRAGQGAHSPLLQCGNILLDASSHRVLVSGKEVDLTLKEYDLLHLFMKNPGKAFSRDALLTAVWNDNYGESRTVDVHVGTLRQKLGSSGSMIRTVRGVGYRFDPDAQESEAQKHDK